MGALGGHPPKKGSRGWDPKRIPRKHPSKDPPLTAARETFVHQGVPKEICHARMHSSHHSASFPMRPGASDCLSDPMWSARMKPEVCLKGNSQQGPAGSGTPKEVLLFPLRWALTGGVPTRGRLSRYPPAGAMSVGDASGSLFTQKVRGFRESKMSTSNSNATDNMAMIFKRVPLRTWP